VPFTLVHARKYKFTEKGVNEVGLLFYNAPEPTKPVIKYCITDP